MAEETAEPRCTCNDEYQTALCPIHGVDGTPDDATAPKKYGKNHNIVNDGGLTSQKLEYFSGYRFVCPVCGQDSVMHYFNYCPNCGSRVIVQSQFVTQMIKQINSKQK